MNIPSEVGALNKTPLEEVTTENERRGSDGKGERLCRIYSALDEIRGSVKNLCASGIYANETVSYFGDIILVTICVNGEK